MDIVWFILIGIAAGWLAGQTMKGVGFGVFGNLVVGIIGALLGGFLFGLLGLTTGGRIGQFITAAVGAIVLMAILRVIKTRKSQPPGPAVRSDDVWTGHLTRWNRIGNSSDSDQRGSRCYRPVDP